MEQSAETLNLFLHAFAARDIAEAIPSFDETTPCSSISAAIHQQSLEVVGVRREGKIVGWLSREDLSAHEVPRCREFDPGSVLQDIDPLHLVVQRLNAAPYLFVRSMGHASGLIRRDDLHKPAARMWLFGLVTITELRMTRVIEEFLPQDSWQHYLSPGRLRLAAEFQAQRSRRGQRRTLLDCLQFSDKARIVARHDEMRRLTRFSSRHATEEFAKRFQSLRNSLAHSQEILDDWPIIVDLAANLQRFVLGPPPANDSDVSISASAGNNHEEQ
jgi:hypothetical protein